MRKTVYIFFIFLIALAVASSTFGFGDRSYRESVKWVASVVNRVGSAAEKTIDLVMFFGFDPNSDLSDLPVYYQTKYSQDLDNCWCKGANAEAHADFWRMCAYGDAKYIMNHDPGNWAIYRYKFSVVRLSNLLAYGSVYEFAKTLYEQGLQIGIDSNYRSDILGGYTGYTCAAPKE